MKNFIRLLAAAAGLFVGSSYAIQWGDIPLTTTVTLSWLTITPPLDDLASMFIDDLQCVRSPRRVPSFFW